MEMLPKSRAISNGVPLHSYTARTGTHLHQEPMPQRNPKQLSVPTRKQCLHNSSRREYRARITQDFRVYRSLAHTNDADRGKAAQFPVGPAEPRRGTTEPVHPAIEHLSNDECWGSKIEAPSLLCWGIGMITHGCSPWVQSASKLDLGHMVVGQY